MQTQLAHQMALASTGDILIASAGAAVFLGALALFFGSLLGIVRSDLTGGMKLVWFLFALMAPSSGACSGSSSVAATPSAGQASPDRGSADGPRPVRP